MTRPLAALMLTDGRPGHYRRAEGILAAIARLRPLAIACATARPRRWLPARTLLLPALTRAHATPAHLLRLVYGIDATALAPAELVVSAGGDTLAANIAAAKLFGARNIFFGRVRRFRPQDFSLILISNGRHAMSPGHTLTPLQPVPLDPDDYPRAGNATLGPQRPPRIAGLLIGGPAGTFRYAAQEWQAIFAFLAAMHAKFGTRWIVANSRRTPAFVSDDIAQIAADARGPIESFIDIRSLGAGTLQPLFAAAEAVVCTDDSSSMITESVWLRRPTVGIAPAESHFAAADEWYRAYLAANGWVCSIPIAELTPDRLLTALAGIRPLAANPLDQLAATVKLHMPDLFPSRQIE